MLHTLLLALAPIYVVLALGYVAGRLRRVAADQVPGLNALVMEFAVPAALFVAMAAAPGATMLGQWRLFLMLGLGIALPYAGWFAVARRGGADAGEAAVQALTVGLPNYVAVGLPILDALRGGSAAVAIAVTVAAGATLPSPVTLLILELAHADGAGPRWRIVAQALRRALTRPIVLAPLLGLCCSLADLHPGDVLTRSLDLLGKASGGAALFVTGLVLSTQRVRLDAAVVLAVLASNVAQPLLTLLFCRLLGMPPEVTQVAVLMNALPSGFFGILFAIGYGRPSPRAGSIVLVSTLSSAATLAVAIAALFGDGAVR